MMNVNYIGVLLAGISAMITGGIWYGPLFSKDWMKLVGLKKEDVKKEEMPKLYGIMFVGALLEAFVLSQAIHFVGASSLMDGAKAGLWAWLGFVGPVMLGNYMFSKKPLKLFFIDSGYALLNLVVMGAVLVLVY